jgi:cytoskeletal protein RodZ
MERQLKPFPGAQPTESEPPPAPVLDGSLPRYQAPVKSKRSKKLKSWLPIIIVVLVIILAGGGYLLIKHRTTPQTHKTTSLTIKPAPSSANQNSTSQYVSNGQDLNLTFGYPADWTVNPPTNHNPNDQTITITSPLTSLTSASGSTVTGKIVVSIRPGTATINELASGSVTAAQNSVQIAFTSPLPSQQQYPYLSFIYLAGGNNPSGQFNEVIVTGQMQFTQNEAVTAADLEQLDPIISASFDSCTTQACTGSGEVPLGISKDSWQNDNPLIETLNLIQSLQLH